MSDLERLIDQIALAQWIDMPVKTIEQWRYRKVGPPYITVGRHVRYRPTDVLAWLERQTSWAEVNPS